MNAFVPGISGKRACPWGPDLCQYETLHEPDLRRHQAQKKHYGEPPAELLALRRRLRRNPVVQPIQREELDGVQDAGMHEEHVHQATEDVHTQPMDADVPVPENILPRGPGEEMPASTLRQARTSARARIPLQPRLQDVLEALPLPDVPEAEPPGDDPPEDPLEYADLSFSERAVLQPLMALHIPHRNQLLTAIQSPDFNPQDIRFRNAKQLHDYMAGHHTEVWEDIRICEHIKCAKKEIIVRVRRDLHAAIQKLLKQKEVRAAFFTAAAQPDSGVRNDVRSGQWFRQQQGFARGAYGEDVGVLPVILYSDETSITQGGINVYPVLMTLALPEALGGQHFHQRIAFLPCLTRTNLGLQIDDAREEERFKALLLDVFVTAFREAMRGLKEMSFFPEVWQVEGQDLSLVALLALYIADQKEAWRISGLRGSGTYFPDISFLVRREELTDPVKTFPRRRVEDTEQTLLDGFNNSNPFRVIFPDELHQGLKGDVEHLIGIIKATGNFNGRQQKAVNDAAMSSPPFAGLRLPSDGIFTSFKFAEQQGALLKVLPPALLAVPTPLSKDLASVMCDYLEYQAVRDLPVHTAASLQRLKALRIVWQRGAVHRLEGVKDFGYIKFFGSRKYEELIDWLGSSMIASASSGEATHKELKHAYAYTNKQGGAAMKQVMTRLWDMDTARALTAEDAEARQIRSAGQWAKERGEPVMVKTGTLMCYRLTDSRDAHDRFRERLALQPDLTQLEPKLRIFLAGFPQDAAAEDLPDTPKCLVKVRPAFAIPHQVHRGREKQAVMVRAVFGFGSQKRDIFDSVAIRCEDTEDVHDCWFGQVRLIFSYEEGGGATARTKEAVLVRWYDKADYNASDRHLQGSFQKLRWAADAAGRPYYDVVELQKVLRAVYIQAHPGQEDVFFYNRFI